MGGACVISGARGPSPLSIAATTLILLGLLMGNEVAQASERKSLIITPLGTIFFHPTSCSRGGGRGRPAQQVRSRGDQAGGPLISGDRACVEAELYNLRFCSFIRPGQRTNELWPSTVSLVFIFLWQLGDSGSVPYQEPGRARNPDRHGPRAQVGGGVPGERDPARGLGLQARPWG